MRPDDRGLDMTALEGLNSSLAQLGGELWPLAKLAKVAFCGTLRFTQLLVFER